MIRGTRFYGVSYKCNSNDVLLRNDYLFMGKFFIVCSKFVNAVRICDWYSLTKPKRKISRLFKISLFFKLVCIFHAFALIFFFSVYDFGINNIHYCPVFLHTVLSINLHSGCKATTASRAFIRRKSPITYWPEMSGKHFFLIPSPKLRHLVKQCDCLIGTKTYKHCTYIIMPTVDFFYTCEHTIRGTIFSPRGPATVC